MVKADMNVLNMKVLNEIRYFVLFSVLKKLLEQGEITLDNYKKVNIAIAEKYGVLQLNI